MKEYFPGQGGPAEFRSFALQILQRPLVKQHAHVRGKPHKETCLNHAYLLEQTDLARHIVMLDRTLAFSSYRGKVGCIFHSFSLAVIFLSDFQVFYGENSLHIMIAKNNSKTNKMLDEARWLLGFQPEDQYGHNGRDLKDFLFRNRRKLLHQPAIGQFFDKENPEHRAYFGELPLSFAVSRNSFEFVKFLVVDCDCWMDKADKHGNTAAHLAVYHDNFPMFLFLWKLWDVGLTTGRGRYGKTKTKFLELESKGDDIERGFTPLVYAAHLGRVEFFQKLWDHMGKTSMLDPDIDPIANGLMPIQWKWGSIRQFLYPLDQVDPLGQIIFFDTDIEGKNNQDMAKIALIHVPMFANVKDDALLDLLVSKMVLKSFKKGTHVLKQGQLSDGKMYIIQKGSCIVQKTERDKKKKKFQLQRRYFGELGALGHQQHPSNTKRAATVTTTTECDIWELTLPIPIGGSEIDERKFLSDQLQTYVDSRPKPCVLNETLSCVKSNIKRKSQEEESHHLELLSSGFLKELIDKKWKRFGAQPPRFLRAPYHAL